MSNLWQRTINSSIACTGIGLHSGAKIKLVLRPALEDSGITFYRTDLPGSPAIKACLENVVNTKRATTLGKDGVTIGTVEHLLSALAGLGLDNVRVDVAGPEVPVMDGSSAPFVHLLKNVGVRTQKKHKKFYVIKQQLSIEDGDKFVSVAPSNELAIQYDISFDHPMVRSQSLDFHFSDVGFEREISRARTFGFIHELEYLKKNGFARGGSLDNAVVIDRFQILNEGGLRYDDEFIRHKVLDFIGDISLVGAPIIGRFKASKSGHTLNNILMNKLMATPEAWTLVDYSEPAQWEMENIRVPSWRLLDVPARQAA